MSGPVLDVADLRVSYTSQSVPATVLSRVTITIGAGEAVGLVGESGCGKSTLALAVMRALPANGTIEAGRIAVAGTDVLALTDHQLRAWRGSAAAMVYQDPTSSLTPTLTVGEQVAEVFRYHEGARRRAAAEAAADILAQVGLTPPRQFLGRYPHQLSGGQRQRVVIAMALAVRPRLLILDEPTTGLDATVQAGILDLLESLRGEFIDALLFITHNLDLITRTCDRINVLYAGRVLESGPVVDVLTEPGHPYTAALLACVPRAQDRAASVRLPAIPGSPPRPADMPPGCTFAARCGLATTACETAEPPLGSYRSRAPDARLRQGALGLAGTAGQGGGPARPGTADWLVRCIRAGEPASASPPPGSAPPPPSTEVLLDVHGLTKRYADVIGCDDVNLVVHRNETLGLVGESGSGKTTVARAIAGLAPADGGEIRWHDSPLADRVARRPRDVARGLQLVPQHPDTTLNPRRRVGAILARAVKRLRGDLPVPELAAAVRLDAHHLASRAHQLSGGQRQRAAIARAFAGRPELVICDEPVSSLDVSVQAVILNLLADLQAERGTSYLFISHDLAVVRYLAHTVAVIYGGRIVESGPADQVFAGPRHPYTELLLTAAFRPGAGGAARPGAGGAGRPGAGGAGRPAAAADEPGPAAVTGCVFAGRCPVRVGSVCETEPPPWREPQPGHRIRCHHPAFAVAAVPGTQPANGDTVLVAPGDG